MEQKESFFDFAAEVGLTKHLGGAGATDRLAALCHLGAGQSVLDVGCGAGATPCMLARHYGCRVTGVDIRPAMVERSRERARREGLEAHVAFVVADAQALPFEDGAFDAVMTESVTAFPADKQKAVREYARVARPGGYVGLNESTWLRPSPPAEVVAWAEQDVGASVRPLAREEWRALLEGAGLVEIVEQVGPVDLQQETKGILRRYGLGGMLRILGRTFRLYGRSPAYRQFVRGVRERGIVPKELTRYFGYGLYVGRNPGG